MADLHSINAQDTAKRHIFEWSTSIGEVHGLLDTYHDLLLYSASWGLEDEEQGRRAQERIFALLTAIKPQLDRLASISDEMLDLGDTI